MGFSDVSDSSAVPVFNSSSLILSFSLPSCPLLLTVQVWDEFNDLLSIKHEAEENCSVADLIVTDNKEIGKIITTFTVLGDECLRLRDVAENEFFGPLSCFGERYNDDPVRRKRAALKRCAFF